MGRVHVEHGEVILLVAAGRGGRLVTACRERRPRDELLNGEIFYTLKEAEVLIEGWRKQYNRVRPHSSLGYRPPAPEAVLLQPAALRSAGSNNPLSAPI